MLILVILANLCQALRTSNCYSVSCRELSEDQCIGVVGSNVYLSECPQGKSCYDRNYNLATTLFDWSNQTCIERYDYGCYVPVGRVPPRSFGAGEKCCGYDSVCYSEKCTENRCEPVQKGRECSFDEVCGPDLWCKDQVCTETRKPGESCERDAMCELGCGCHLGTCTLLFSLDVGTDTDCWECCETTYRNPEGRCDQIAIWEETSSGPVQLEYPFECEVGNDCAYYSHFGGKLQERSECVCSGEGTNSGYCSEYWGFKYADPYIAKIKNKINWDNSICSGRNALGLTPQSLFGCNLIDKETYRYAKELENKETYWPVFHSGVIDECASKLGLFDKDYIEHYESKY